MGYFLVDGPDGRIGNLRPGNPGYKEAALARHQVVFGAGGVFSSHTVNLPSSKYLGWYLVSGGTTAQAMENGEIPVFFSYSAANTDGLSHLHAQADSQTWAWEDVFAGGDRDFNDLVFRFNIGEPFGLHTILPSLYIGDITVIEGDQGIQDANFTVRLSEASAQTVTTHFATVDDTAKAGEDYEAQTGMITFATGELEKTISIKVSGDRLQESTESFKVNLANANNALISQGVGIGTIFDNDNLTPVLPSLSIGDITVTEEDEGSQKANFAVRLSQASEQTVTVEFVTEDDTAKNSEDYETQTGIITFAPGELEKTISVKVSGDRRYELTESFKVTLVNANNALISQGTGIGSIFDNDNLTPDLPSLSIGDLTLTEGDEGSQKANFAVRLSQASEQTITVEFVTEDDTAKNSEDYETLTGMITFALGELEKIISVKVSGDRRYELTESFKVTLVNANNALISQGTGCATILDNDTLPTITVQSTSIVEGDGEEKVAQFEVTLSEDSGTPVTVDYETLDGTAKAAEDYQETVGSLTFAPGETRRFIEVSIISELVNEADELFTLRLEDPTNGTLDNSEAQGTIINDDAGNKAPSALGLTPTTVNENIPDNSAIAQFSTVDINAGDTHSYQLVPGQGDLDNNAFAIVGNELQIKQSPNFEQKAVYQIRVRTTDEDGLFLEKAFMINIVDINEAPTIINLSNNSLAENITANSFVGTISGQDYDASDSLSYELVDNLGGEDNGSFTLVSNELRLKDSPNFEAKSSYNLRLKAIDKGGLSLEKNFVIQITDVNEAPFIISQPILTAEVGTAYQYEVKAQDPDTNDILTISAIQNPLNWTKTDTSNGVSLLSQIPTVNDIGQHIFEWKVQDAGGLTATQNYTLAVSALLKEGNNFSPSLQKAITVPTNPTFLRFKIEGLSFDQTDTNSIKDAFEVELVDAQGNSLVHTIGSDKTAFLNITEGLTASLAPGVTYDANTGIIRVNLVGVQPNTTANLVLRLVNNDQDTATQVRITEITLENTPPGTVAPIATPEISALQSIAQTPNLTNLADVTGSIEVQYQRTTLNEDTNLVYADFSLRNIGSYGVNTNLLVAIKNISDQTVQVRDTDGVTLEGLPYYDFTDLLVNSKLDFNQVTNSRSLVFLNPNQVQFTYDVVVLAVVNRNPIIQTQPELEIIGGQSYQYDLNAIDADLDNLSYRLLVAPQGMTIDAVTGLINWQTATTNIGNQVVKVEVTDGRGGFTQQSYTLSVIDTPPNRPPVFTSNPVVDAYINQPYQYGANAIDPDRNYPLTYNLVIGPDGMTINQVTGETNWTPPAALLLGDTVLGRISLPGENSEFTFSGMKGQRIYFDPLQFSGNYQQWQVDIYSPSNKKVVDGTYLLWNYNQLFVLEEDGNYRVAVNPQGEQIGTYAFSLIESSLVPVISLDSVIQGTLSPGSEDDLYRFTANKGQKLYFDKLSQNGTLGWILYNSANQVVASDDNFNDMEVDLAVDGEYILALRGNSAFTSAVNYAFTIITPNLLTNPLTLGAIVEGAISEKGEQDTYTFTGTAGQQLFFDSLGSDFLYAYLYDPSGRQLWQHDSRNDRGTNDGLVFAVDGTYKLVIDGGRDWDNYSVTGNYKFRLLDKADATIINLDEDITGTFDNRGFESDSYRFTLTDRTYLYIDGQLGNYDNAWILYGSNGQYITSKYFYQGQNSDSYNDAELWLESGDYWLILQGNGAERGDGKNDYKVRIVTPQLNMSRMHLGTTITGTISEVGEQDAYTFEGTAGQQLFYDALGGDFLKSRFFDPTGREIFNVDSRNDRGSDGSLTLSMNGTYKVLIDGERDATGSYGFRLLDKADATVINLDTDIAETFDYGGFESDSYHFTLTDRRYLYFDGQLGNYDNAWILYGSNGQYITSKYFYQGQNSDSYNDAELWLESGDYWLILQGNGAERGDGKNDYKVRIVTPQLNMSRMHLGTTITGTISEVGEQDAYTFEGTAGQQLFYDALGGDFLKSRFFDPTGRELFNVDSRNDRGPDGSLTLAMNGTYKVLIDGERDATGSYGFRLLDKADATVINLDTNITGTFDNGGFESDSCRFTLTDKSYLYIDGQLGNHDNAWILYNSNGQTITYRTFYQGHYSDSYNDAELWLESGDYWLILQGNKAESWTNGSNDYKIRIVTPLLNTTPITLGSTINGSISEQGEQDAYTFTGTIGQQISFNVLAPGQYRSINAYLHSTSGSQIFSRWLSDQITTPITLTEAGQYTLRLDGNWENTDAYSFSLVDLGEVTSVSVLTGTPIILGNVVSGSIRNVNQIDSYTFTGTVGQQLFYDALDNNVRLRFYDPTGRELFNVDNRSDRGELVLTMNGTYRLTLSERFGNYSFRLLDKTDATAINLDTDISGTLDYGGFESDNYRFTLTEKSYLYFDKQIGSYANAWILYGSGGQYITSKTFYQGQNSDSHNDAELWLESGNYWLILQGNGVDSWFGGSNDYKIRIVTPQLNTTAMILGTTITGTISEQGEQDAYTFEGTAGQQLFYDSLGGDLLKFRFFDPTGRELFNVDSRSDHGSDGNLTLSLNGTYKVLIDGERDAIGSYGFRLLDKADATLIYLDTDLTGTFDNGGFESDSYRFTLTDRSYLYFDGQLGNYDNALILYGSNGKYITSKYFYQGQNSDSYNDAELWLESGDYWLILQGNKAESYTNGNNNYKLRVVTPQLNTAPMTLGTTITGTISAQGEQDAYTFEGTAGQKLFYDGFGDVNLRFRFFDPIGREIFNMESRYDRAPDNSLTLTMNGIYRVVIDGERDATGSYGFRLFDKADATIINLYTDITGTLDNGGFESDSYRFTLTDRSYLYFDKQFGVFDNAWILYGSGGQYITSKTFYQGQNSDSYNDAELWLDSGEYWLILQGNGAEGWNGSSNDYKIRLVTPQFNTAPMNLGTTITGTISEVGEQDTYTFEGTAGQQLFYDALGGDFLKFRFFDPTGRELFNVDSRSDRGSDGNLTLSLNGTYKVLIDGERDAIGSYGFRLLDKADATLIYLDTDLTGTFDNGGFESDSYRFTLTDRSYLYFDGQLGNYDNALILYGSNGKYITSKYFYQGQNSDSYNDAELWLESGDYWLILQGNKAESWTNGSNSYKLRVVTPQLNIVPLTLGTKVTGTISEVGEQDTYTFTGTAGQQLFYDAFAGEPNILVNLYSPTGRLLRTSDVRTDIGPDGGYTLNQAGIYSLVIDGIRDYTGNYGFRLLDKAKATVIAFDHDISGTFANGGLDSQAYRFTVTTDQYLYFDAQGDRTNQWLLYGNGGQLVTNTALSNDQEFWLGKGEYLLVAQGNGGANLDYQFRLVTPVLITNSITLGSQVSGNIAEAGEQDTYTFTGSVGQQLFFDALVGNSNIKARLYAPSDTLVLDHNTGTDAIPFTLTEKGTYRLVIDASNNTTGEYNFILVDRATATNITPNTLITDTLSASNEAVVYKLTGEKGNRFTFDLAANNWDSRVNWKLYDPNNHLIATPSRNSPDFKVTLTSDGLYSLVIQGENTEAINYSFNVIDNSVTGITSTGMRTAITSTITNAGDVSSYIFQASAGSLIWLDQLTASTWEIRARLKNPDGTYAFSDHDTRYDRGAIQLEQTGTYTLETFGYYRGTTGSWQFQIIDLIDDPTSSLFNPQPFNSIQEATLSSGTTTEVYQIEVIVGQKLFFNGIRGRNLYVDLIDPNGQTVFSQGNFDSRHSTVPTLTQEGIYYLVVSGQGGGNKDYSYQLINLAAGPRLPINLPVKGRLDSGQQSVVYQVEGKANQTLFFDINQGSTSARIKVYDLNRQDILYDTLLHPSYNFELMLQKDGIYTVLIEGGNSNTPIDYNFQVSSSTSQSLNVLTPGDGESNDVDKAIAKFAVKVAVEDTQGAKAIQDFMIRLWPDPDNAAPTIISAPETRHALTQPIYRYQLTSIDPDQDKLQYRLTQAPNGAFINKDSGELLWYLDSSVTAGISYDFSVEVTDSRGGLESQVFKVETFAQLGSIQGLAFEDLNRNGILDLDLVKGNNPDVFFVIEYSCAVSGGVVDWTKADLATAFSQPLTAVDQELGAILLLSEYLTKQGFGDTANIGILDGRGEVFDMDPSLPGIQTTTTPLADKNNNGILDIRESLRRPIYGSSPSAIVKAINLHESLGLTGDLNVMFMTSGNFTTKPEEKYQVDEAKAAGVNISAFSFGFAAMPKVREIDQDATLITSTQQVYDIFTGNVLSKNFEFKFIDEPLLEDVLVYLDINNNGFLDTDEPQQFTQKPASTSSTLETSRYYFNFNNLLPGAYTVRQVLPEQYSETSPITGSFVDVVTDEQNTFKHFFGIAEKLNPSYNQAPVIISQAPTGSINVGEKLIYHVTATDADLDPLLFDLSLSPEGMTIEPTSGIIVWQPTVEQVGNQPGVLLRVQDGKGGVTTQYFELQVTSPNTSPLFTSLVPNDAKAQSGKTFQFQATAIDADNDTLTYSFNNSTPNGFTIDATTGLVSWTPDNTQIGTRQFTVKVEDGKGGQAFQSVTLTVNTATNNQAPIFISTPRTTTRIGSSYFYQIEATDPNGDTLTYNLVNAPTGMTIKNGLISWQSTAAQAGQQAVTIQASDGTLTREQTYQITVSHQASNRAPVITSAPNLTTNIEQIYTYNLTGQDPDGDLVFWSLDQAPSGMVLDIQTGVLRWQPQSNQLGEQEVIVRLLDSYGDYSTQSFTLAVNGTNTPVNVLSNPITRAAVGQAYTYDVAAVDPENSPLTYSLGRRPNGMTIDARGKVQWTPTQVGSYDIDVSVSDNQGATTTQTYRLEVGSTAINHAPNITSTPGFVANVGSAYQYQIEASDPDGQTLRYQLLESPQGMTIETASGLLSWTTPVNGNYQVVLAAFDAEGLGVTQGYTLTAKVNSLPVIRSTPGLEAVPNQTYRYDLQAVDPDGDSLRYSLDATSQALGMNVDAQGRLTWTPNDSQLGYHAVTLTATDAAGGATQQTFTLKVTADITAPQVRINRSLSLINQGETVSFQVVATDNVGIANLQLLINDTPVIIDSNGVASFTATTKGVITAKAVALDGAGNRGEATTTVNVLDPTDTEAPTVSLNLSAIVNGEITAPVEIKGSVKDTNLDHYVLEVAPADGSQPFKEMFRGTSTVENDVLGVLDPTLLPNDTYQVRLVAYDVNGAGNSVSQLLDVKGDLKLGNFQLSFTDLEIPVSGIPITVTRTYDTLTSNSQADFGYGWRMEFRNAQLRTSLPKDELYQDLGLRSVGFKEGDSVYITLPGGKRERFTFKLESMKVMGIPLTAYMGNRALYIPTFVADKDSTSSLTVNTAGIALIKGIDGQVVPVSGGSAFAHYNTQDWGNYYQLTTKDGIVYNIDATTGDINTITNRNGDILSFSDGGIVSSNGQQVTFERDAQGRIVAAIDPMGNRVSYRYDANGDLVKVTDRESNTTTFEYNGQQAHYLDKIIDPLGKTGVRNEYDENGRLSKVFNALGNSVQLEYNPDNSLYTTKDALGNATTYEYDLRGNVITEVDAKGGITRRTYDEDNNQLSETNPEGETKKSTYDSSGNKLTETDALGNVTRYTYNAKGDLLSTTDALGNTITNTYDSNGNPTAISGLANGPINLTYSAGGLLKTLTTAEGTTTYEYDRRGNVTKELDPLGHETIYTYDGNGNRLTETRKLTTAAGVQTLVTTTEYNAKGDVIKVTDALGNVTQMAYDANGQKTQEIDALGRVTKYVYSDAGQLLETVYADATPNNDSDNPRTRKDYDAANRVVAEIDELGRRTQFQYDGLGRLTFTLFPDLTPTDATDNARTESRYDDAGRVIAEVDERGNITRYEYDVLGRRTKTILPDGTANNDSDNPQFVVTYDALGRQLTQIDPLGRTTQFFYDGLGRSIGQTFADQTDISTTYDLAGRVVGKTDQMGNKTRYEYNAVGQLTAVIDALNQRTEYQYNELGNLISQRDALGNTTRYEYDGLGRRIATDLPSGQETTMTYDAVGNLLTTTDFNGAAISFEYDERNRLISRIFPDNNRFAYTYTLTGQRTTETSSLGTITYGYDVRDNLLSRVDADGVKIEYGYDVANNRTAIKVPSGQTSYNFDEQNRLKTVIDPQAGVTTYTYDLAGNLIKTTLANGTTETREYDLLNRLLYLKNSNSSGVINSFRYTIDKVGNRLAIDEQDGRQSNYKYDALYRLLQEEIIDGTTRTTSYTYDAVSNRLTRDDSLEGKTVYEYDANDRLLKEVTNGVTTTYSYDNNGNTLTKTVGTEKTTYEWDIENRLVGADTDGDGVNDVTNVYDGDGVRIRQTVAGEETRFLVDKNRDYAQVLEEYTPSNIIKASYVYGHDLISQSRDTERSFYHVDGLGSTRALTDINGLLTDAYAYVAFGKIVKQLGNTQNSYLFAGEQRDLNLGLDYLRARYLDFYSGRFYGRDPFIGLYRNPVTLNKYIYANSNPVNIIDPSGNFGFFGGFAIGFSIGFGLGLGAAYYPASGIQKEQGGNSSLFTTFQSSDPRYHRFYLKTDITSGDQETAKFVYKILKHYPAPRTDFSTEVFNGQESVLQGGNPVVHILYDGILALVNYTKPGHIFYEGKVVRQVKMSGGMISIESTGDGIGKFPLLNKILFKVGFGYLDRRIVTDVKA